MIRAVKHAVCGRALLQGNIVHAAQVCGQDEVTPCRAKGSLPSGAMRCPSGSKIASTGKIALLQLAKLRR